MATVFDAPSSYGDHLEASMIRKPNAPEGQLVREVGLPQLLRLAIGQRQLRDGGVEATDGATWREEQKRDFK